MNHVLCIMCYKKIENADTLLLLLWYIDGL